MMFLKKFWSGDIAPGEGRYHTSEEYAKSYTAMGRCEAFLMDHLDIDCQRVFREFSDAAQEVSALGCCDNFIDGFRMGALLMADILMTPGNS